MSNLIERARTFATSAHQRIGHQRKYNNQPYHVHLQAVAELVASVTDDLEMVAAAWLHDTVEDTPAMLDDISENFGAAYGVRSSF
jgi:(p)ppGpp synthase/HD superfamily hydrolase